MNSYGAKIINIIFSLILTMNFLFISEAQAKNILIGEKAEYELYSDDTSEYVYIKDNILYTGGVLTVVLTDKGAEDLVKVKGNKIKNVAKYEYTLQYKYYKDTNELYYLLPQVNVYDFNGEKLYSETDTIWRKAIKSSGIEQWCHLLSNHITDRLINGGAKQEEGTGILY